MSLLGIDEVGRGPLAGPLVVGAVIIPEYLGPRPEWIEELRDSKKLSAKKREQLAGLIWREIPAGLGWVSACELDTLGVSLALKLATRRAVKSVQALHVNFSQIMIDGKVNFLAGTSLEQYVSTKVKADDLVKEVSAASIVAKVARDRYMAEMAALYPGYGFEKNAGYGTLAHRNAIHEVGICPEHRRSYEPIKSMVGSERSSTNVVKNTTNVGKKAEEAVCKKLEGDGHLILMRNWKTKFCEIDIVSLRQDYIYFTEVKYRKTDIAGSGLDAVTREKQRKMKFAAEVFLKCHPKYQILNPALAVASVAGDYKVNDWFTVF
ncbi:ribonuclease HII [Candidatus Saccharibacteria bacterium]|nr:ribonuclease HII [Candidatus Saccharibacteria bacterium]